MSLILDIYSDLLFVRLFAIFSSVLKMFYTEKKKTLETCFIKIRKDHHHFSCETISLQRMTLI